MCTWEVHWHILLDEGPWSTVEGEIWGSNHQPKHTVANCSQTVSPMLPPGEYKPEVGWSATAIPPFARFRVVTNYFGACSRMRPSVLCWWNTVRAPRRLTLHQQLLPRVHEHNTWMPQCWHFHPRSCWARHSCLPQLMHHKHQSPTPLINHNTLLISIW